ncbi:hypothetical protein NBRC116594_38680 [Shimia sp. NS0008-38b]
MAELNSIPDGGLYITVTSKKTTKVIRPKAKSRGLFAEWSAEAPGFSNLR